MATLKEHIHVFKKHISNYVKSFLILFIMDTTLICAIALGLFQIECTTSTNTFQEQQNQDDSMSWITSQKLCQSFKAWNKTTSIHQQNKQKDMKEHLQQLCTEVWQTTQTSLESKNNKCTLTWLNFTKWFYFASMTSRALGELNIIG